MQFNKTREDNFKMMNEKEYNEKHKIFLEQLKIIHDNYGKQYAGSLKYPKSDQAQEVLQKIINEPNFFSQDARAVEEARNWACSERNRITNYYFADALDDFYKKYARELKVSVDSFERIKKEQEKNNLTKEENVLKEKTEENNKLDQLLELMKKQGDELKELKECNKTLADRNLELQNKLEETINDLNETRKEFEDYKEESKLNGSFIMKNKKNGKGNQNENKEVTDFFAPKYNEVTVKKYLGEMEKKSADEIIRLHADAKDEEKQKHIDSIIDICISKINKSSKNKQILTETFETWFKTGYYFPKDENAAKLLLEKLENSKKRKNDNEANLNLTPSKKNKN